MCGIAGILNKHSSTDALSTIAQKMGAAIHHRGPDSSGQYIEPGVAIAHQRLAILDLSPAGHQPMTSNNGRFVISLNGEIYNFQSLKKNTSYAYRGTSDTEVLLALFEKIGIKETLAQISGMFAFSAWDREEKKLYLARDRLGEKPLYYANTKKSFLFGSEIKAIKASGELNTSIDYKALSLYIKYSYVPDPTSIYAEIKKVPPGSCLIFDTKTQSEELHQYWDVKKIISSPPPTDLEAKLKDTIKTVIAEQIISDVPLGAFLSGGIDSSFVTALMTQVSKHKVKTFSIGFSESLYDESPYAKKIANILGTDHTELYVNQDDALKLIPNLPLIYDEPFADSSQIPTALLARLTKKHVTVALSGDGGDEVFAGYNRYLYGPKIWQRISWLPKPMRALLSQAIESMPAGVIAPVLNLLFSQPQSIDKFYKVLRMLRQDSISGLYRALVQNNFSDAILINQEYTELSLIAHDDNVLFQQLNDLTSYLPGDILVKVDRAAMASSLETRAPLIDHRIIELALHLQPSQKISASTNEMKLFLRNWLYEFIPAEEFKRPKTGFAVPIGAWLRTSLKSWGSDLLSEERLSKQKILNAKEVTKMWSEHQSKARDHSHKLWTLLMLQSWLDNNS